MVGRRIAGVFLCVLGAIWILQGVDVLQGSSMTGEGIWAVFGIVLVVVGITLLRVRRT